MRKHLRNLKSYFLIILASIGIGVVITHPIAPHLMSECLYNQINDTSIPDRDISDQWNECLMQPQIISTTTTMLATFLLAVWFRRRLLNETPVKHIAIVSLIYGLLQFISLIFLQSHYFYDAQQATTFGEIVQSYWFAADAIIYYLIAVFLTSLLLNRRNQPATL